MGYGVNTVVGGFGFEPQNPLPHTIARTYIEHQQLRETLQDAPGGYEQAIEVGCGYGRMIPVLNEFANKVAGIERDPELIAIAESLNPDAAFIPYYAGNWKQSFPENSVDLALTFTFLQHLSCVEAELVAHQIMDCVKSSGIIIIVEETRELKDDTTTGRTVEQYSRFFSFCELLSSEERKLEPTNKLHGGHYMVFRRK